MGNNSRSNATRLQRPPLEWRPLAVFTGPDPVVPDNLPEHVKEKARRKAAVLVEIASAGFDHKNGVDRVKFSYKIGWEVDEKFIPTSHMPDERVTEFIIALQKASAEAKVAHNNAIKSAKGALTANLEKQLGRAVARAEAAAPQKTSAAE